MIDKFTILGGSSVYIPELVLSLISHNVHIKEIVLFGRPGQKLDIVAQFCQRLINKSGFPSAVRPSTDLEEAVTDAKYVLNHIRVGGLKARLRDEKIPPQEGMIGDETLGPGGLTNALRTLPIVLDYAARVEHANPDCYFINLTNPLGIVVEALTRYSKLKVIGVCDLPGRCTKSVAGLLGRTSADVKFNFIGLNHMGWIQDVRVGKQSYMPLVLEMIDRRRDDGFDSALVDLFRMVPTRTVGLYFHRDRILKKQRSCSRYRAEVLYEAEKQILKLYADKALCEIPELTKQRNTIWYEETILPLIQALESDQRKEYVLCVKNEGAIRDLPSDCSVEVPVVVSASGTKPRKVGDCPHFAKGLFIAIKESERQIVEAVCHQSYEYALQALTINPWVPSLEAARHYLDRVKREEEFSLH